MPDKEINLSEDGTKDYAVAADELFDAVAYAILTGEQITWILDDTGARVAAVVPASYVAQRCLRHLKPCHQDNGYHADGSRCRP
jgi:hypothetical protein